MWICSKYGFFSFVENTERGMWEVRARSERDLRELLDISALRNEIALSTQDESRTEYQYRTTVGLKDLLKIFEFLGRSIDYTNFREVIQALPEQQDKAKAYNSFWNLMRQYEEDREDPSTPPPADIVAQRLGGNLSRMLETLNGFKEKYGHWPTLLRIPTSAMKALEQRHLTPFGVQGFRTKLQLVVGDQERLRAEDEAGLAFDYAKEGWSGRRPPRGADEWLWNVRL